MEFYLQTDGRMPKNGIDFVDREGRVVGRITDLEVPEGYRVIGPDDCPSCGRTLQVGDFPFCPHGRGANTVVPDDIPGGIVVENGFPEPVKFYSHSAHRRALEARGLQQRIDNRGPEDKICPRWDTVDLEGAAQLVTRGVEARRAKRDERWKDANIPIAVRILDGEGVRRKDLA